MAQVPALPFLTAALAGTGGRLRDRPEDFIVEEVPAYAATGAGDHVFVWIEKRDLTTQMAVTALARALGVAGRDIGVAGMKDRRAVTRQWLSLPPPVTPERVLAIGADLPGLTVLDAKRHGHKLRTGHLRGNRFVLQVRGVGDATIAATRAQAVLAALAEAPGAPNWFGEQRFGRAGDNAAQGRALLRGEDVRAPEKLRRLFVSALQSELFNEWLRRRLLDGHWRAVLTGELLQKRASGGMFPTEAPDVDGPRVLTGELVATGPMFGHRMRAPAPGTEAAAREDAILAWAELAADDFRRVGALGEGTRRAAAISIEEPTAAPADEPDAIVVTFALPSGAYATTVMREVMKLPAAEAPSEADSPDDLGHPSADLAPSNPATAVA